MSEDKKQEISPPKLNVDYKKQYIISLPNGEKITVKLNNREIETVENWFNLIGKHDLRFDIENILQMFDELNITQISHMVEQSKSTVARHLKLMEEDGLIISKKTDKYQKGKIPPKLYKLNRKLLQVLENSPVNIDAPKDPKKLVEFYKTEIDTYRATIYRFKTVLNLLNPLLDNFEKQLENDENLPIAKEMYDTYLGIHSEIVPMFGYCYISEKYHDMFIESQLTHVKKIIDILAQQNNDPEVKERVYAHISAFFPIKALYELKKEEIKDKK
ncbi:MAG: winged helix-turn-helix domain-containing protein [Promethearchaeota archaeon]